ncbi:AMP-binding protein [Kaarinaea lacus]
MTDTIPLFCLDDSTSLQTPVAFWKGRLITRNEFLHHAQTLARTLPESRYVINLCNDRYLFLVAFAAVIISRQTNLLPPNRAPATILDVLQTYKGSYCLSEEDLADIELTANQCFKFTVPEPCLEEITGEVIENVPEIPGQHVAAIAFTSGSTGHPNPYPKSWSSLVQGTQKAQHRFAVGTGATTSIVATVPPQHMYGLETTIMLPLLTNCCIFAGKAFFPEDIREALNAISEPRLLITTPVHLRACVDSGIQWPAIGLIISATAPLDTALASTAEKIFSAPVKEIYGCTEAGSIASRRTTELASWTPYEGLSISQEADTSYVNSDHLDVPTPLADIIEVEPDGKFHLVGRKNDLLNVAGKRASLSDLNKKLLGINGVQDGIIFSPNDNSSNTTRLIAFVVAPNKKKEDILEQLANMVDRAFLPRPLFLVDKLPRTETSKLPRKNLIEMYASLCNEDMAS